MISRIAQVLIVIFLGEWGLLEIQVDRTDWLEICCPTLMNFSRKLFEILHKISLQIVFEGCLEASLKLLKSAGEHEWILRSLGTWKPHNCLEQDDKCQIWLSNREKSKLPQFLPKFPLNFEPFDFVYTE